MNEQLDIYYARGTALTIALRNYLNGAVGRSALTDAMTAFEAVIPNYNLEPFVDHNYPDSCNPTLNQDPELAMAAQELDAAIQEARAHQEPYTARSLQPIRQADLVSDKE